MPLKLTQKTMDGLNKLISGGWMIYEKVKNVSDLTPATTLTPAATPVNNGATTSRATTSGNNGTSVNNGNKGKVKVVKIAAEHMEFLSLEDGLGLYKSVEDGVGTKMA